jgi:HSP20 family protein
MKIHSIIRRGGANLPDVYGDRNDVFSLQRDVNRLFGEFFGGELMPYRGLVEQVATFTPRMDVSETEKEIKVTTELPGLTEKEVEVTLENDTLTIKGEKKAEQENKTAHSYRIERSFGAFERVIPLNTKVNPEGITAAMKNGILTVVLPKAEPEKAQGHKVQVKAE